MGAVAEMKFNRRCFVVSQKKEKKKKEEEKKKKKKKLEVEVWGERKKKKKKNKEKPCGVVKGGRTVVVVIVEVVVIIIINIVVYDGTTGPGSEVGTVAMTTRFDVGRNCRRRTDNFDVRKAEYVWGKNIVEGIVNADVVVVDNVCILVVDIIVGVMIDEVFWNLYHLRIGKTVEVTDDVIVDEEESGDVSPRV